MKELEHPCKQVFENNCGGAPSQQINDSITGVFQELIKDILLLLAK